MSNDRHSIDDDRLIELLRAAAGELDQPPSDLVTMAKESFTWRTVDAELAELTFDSLDADALAGVRGTAVARSLTFEVRDVVVDVEVAERGELRDLLGQVSPEGTTALTLERIGGRTAIVIDELGRFRCEGVRPGPVRFVVARADGSVSTEWVIL